MKAFLAQTILNTTVKKTTNMKEKDKDVTKLYNVDFMRSGEKYLLIGENRTKKIRKKIVVAIGTN